MRNDTIRFAVTAAVVLAAAGCASSREAAKRPATPPPAPVAQAAPAPAPETSLRGQMLHEVADVARVYFPYDSAELSSEAMATLARNAEWLKAHPDVKAQVAGHCDQRGTDAYNLALGERRARRVRDYYVSLGLDESRIGTISYGKEKPLCRRMRESCWSKNRRAETLVTFSQDVSDSR